ncbi:MAG: DUF1844 domain-containing protein [Phycisphaerae bacterium]
MTDGSDDKKIFIDSDWKEEAAQEKARLAEQEQVERERKAAATAAAAGTPDGADVPNIFFFELLNMIAMQSMVAMGLYSGPGGESIPANPESAKLCIGMLDMLNEKTKGNLKDEEEKALTQVLHELRMQFVKTIGTGMGGMSTEPAGDPETAGGE